MRKAILSGFVMLSCLVAFFADGCVALGHRRLAIIDLSEDGLQPMTSDGKTLWLVYNGEIYNYVELRAELAAQGVGGALGHVDHQATLAVGRADARYSICLPSAVKNSAAVPGIFTAIVTMVAGYENIVYNYLPKGLYLLAGLSVVIMALMFVVFIGAFLRCYELLYVKTLVMDKYGKKVLAVVQE